MFSACRQRGITWMLLMIRNEVHVTTEFYYPPDGQEEGQHSIDFFWGIEL